MIKRTLVAFSLILGAATCAGGIPARWAIRIIATRRGRSRSFLTAVFPAGYGRSSSHGSSLPNCTLSPFGTWSVSAILIQGSTPQTS
jgi:hypothetical protein